MKIKYILSAMVVLAGMLAGAGWVRGDQEPVKEGKQQEQVDVRMLLEKGREAGELPEELVIRISACLGELDAKRAAPGVPKELRESWEITSKQVHRVVFEYKKDKSTYRRVESRSFDSKEICKEFLEGKAIEIEARKGKGEKVAFAGSPYGRGSRSIEVVWKGETILELLETNGAVLVLYQESDARAFGVLYERLARPARVLFMPKAAEAK